jgi:hypothetical protein
MAFVPLILPSPPDPGERVGVRGLLKYGCDMPFRARPVPSRRSIYWFQEEQATEEVKVQKRNDGIREHPP